MRLIRKLLVLTIVGVAGVAAYAYWSDNGSILRGKATEVATGAAKREAAKLAGKAAETGVVLEINADPHRLDLDWRLVRQARDRGAVISIGADAHSVSGLSYVEFGINMARKGWLGPGDILNTRPVADFVAYARRRR